MNKKKYMKELYPVQEIRDLKDLLDSSAIRFSHDTAYLVKDVPGGTYQSIPFWQVKQDVDSLGTELIEMGLKSKKIAVVGENSYPWVVTYLATVNGTGVVVPIDKELPEKEMLHLLERADVSCVVFDGKHRDVMNVIRHEVDFVEHWVDMNLEPQEDSQEIRSWEAIRAEGKAKLSSGNSEFVEAEIDPDALCSLLFTSGTTGMAKGVMLSHRNIAANVYSMSQYVQIKKPGIGLSVLPMHHSYEMTCHIMTALYQGVTVAICEGLKHIAKNMVEAKATVMLGVPLVFEATYKKIMKQAAASGKDKTLHKAMEISKRLHLYNRGDAAKKMFGDVHKATGGHIDLFIAGGAAINPSVIEDFQAMGFPMIQGYGMTENAPIIAVNKDRFSKPDSVGFPLPGTEVRIHEPDENGVGEVICQGPSVMLGYYENPEETARVIRDGWLFTGDYGYFDEDGMLYISGRKKSVIVTKNGKNIFPEEVEFYLTESEYIEEALVYGDEDEDGDVIVKAIIYPNFEMVNSEEGELENEELKRFLKGVIDTINEQMPLYKRVRRFGVRRKEFEKTTTRKVKRFTPENFESDC